MLHRGRQGDIHQCYPRGGLPDTYPHLRRAEHPYHLRGREESRGLSPRQGGGTYLLRLPPCPTADRGRPARTDAPRTYHPNHAFLHRGDRAGSHAPYPWLYLGTLVPCVLRHYRHRERQGEWHPTYSQAFWIRHRRDDGLWRWRERHQHDKGRRHRCGDGECERIAQAGGRLYHQLGG